MGLLHFAAILIICWLTMRSKLDLIISQRLADPAINNFMFIVMAVEMSRTQQLQLRCRFFVPILLKKFRDSPRYWHRLCRSQTLERAAPLQADERFSQQVGYSHNVWKQNGMSQSLLKA
jgi:hypothetical protein